MWYVVQIFVLKSSLLSKHMQRFELEHASFRQPNESDDEVLEVDVSPAGFAVQLAPGSDVCALPVARQASVTVLRQIAQGLVGMLLLWMHPQSTGRVSFVVASLRCNPQRGHPNRRHSRHLGG